MVVQAATVITENASAMAQTVLYQDPQNRFKFYYPAEFGAVSPGTDDGVGSRVAAIRFANFSAGVASASAINCCETCLHSPS